jgi:ribosomal protein L37AE/L43A
MNIDVSTCPICKLWWSDEETPTGIHLCIGKCGMDLTPGGNLRRKVGDYYILWLTKESERQGTTIWYCGNRVFNTSEILPFDLTEDTIKLYLVFQ